MFAISMSSHSVIFAGAGYVLSAVGAIAAFSYAARAVYII
jgi:hypothetical protein